MSMLSVRAVIAIVVLFISACCCCNSLSPLPGAPSANLPSGTPAVVDVIGEIVSYEDTSYADPAPVGTMVGIGDLSITVARSIRPADAQVEAENPFNASPRPGNEYVLVDIMVACNASQSDTCHISSFVFSLVGSRGIAYDQKMFVVLSNALPAAEMYGGSTVSGQICFEVDQSETGLMLVYEVPTWGQGYKAFLSLP